MVSKLEFYILFVVIVLFCFQCCSTEQSKRHIIEMMLKKKRANNDYELSVKNLIQRVVGDKHNIDDFVVSINDDLNTNGLDTFKLEMIENNKKLRITANSGVAASWGFNYYLKYYCNSSIYWSGKNINLNAGPLPIVKGIVAITARDYVRFYQNVCTYSYSYVWWKFDRWEYEIDWMALNGINLVYAQTAAEYPLIKVFTDLGLTLDEINNFFVGPAYLAWFRMGNLKKFGGPLPSSWHLDQLNLQKDILKRYDELGIKYVLPAFASFVPDQMERLFTNFNFTKATAWVGFSCNYTCTLMLDPMNILFQKIGQAYNKEVIQNFGTAHFYSADVFNEMKPNSTDLSYLKAINKAVFDSIQNVDNDAVWVMQAWLFNDPFWNKTERAEAFLSGVPLGKLLVLDLWAEEMPHYQNYSSFYGHNFVWNMLLNFGGSNGIYGPYKRVNIGPDKARLFPNSTMTGIGITMEGINQNEFMFEFMLEKSWRSFLNPEDLPNWVQNFTNRRYYTANTPVIPSELTNVWLTIVANLYNTDDYQNKQLFTQRPSLNLRDQKIENFTEIINAWNLFVSHSDLLEKSDLFRYDLVDLTKEVLRYLFNQKYEVLVSQWNAQDLYSFNDIGSDMLDILDDMEELLASDRRFLLFNWLNDAKLKATNLKEKQLYEWNARAQITLWGLNYTSQLFDYACKGWSGLVKDYYIPRWQTFIKTAEKAIIEGKPIDQSEYNENLLINVEMPFISSTKTYPSYPVGDSIQIVQKLNEKYRN